jgi:hypothetical protein
MNSKMIIALPVVTAIDKEGFRIWGPSKFGSHTSYGLNLADESSEGYDAQAGYFDVGIIRSRVVVDVNGALTIWGRNSKWPTVIEGTAITRYRERHTLLRPYRFVRCGIRQGHHFE